MRKSQNFRFFLLLVGVGLLFWVNELLVGYFGVIVKNTGISFGFNVGGNILNLAILVMLGGWVVRKGEEGLLLVFWGGGLNLVERTRYGFVRDYWYLGFGVYNNLADWIIALGAMMYIMSLWRKRSK